MPLTVRVNGIEKVVRGFDHAPRIIEEEVDDAFTTVMGDIVTDLADYPPERPGQRYVRTGDLGRGWTQTPQRFAAQGAAIALRVTNPVPYAQYVQGQKQAWMHKGRWDTVQAVLDHNRSAIVKAGETAIAAAADRIARGET
jgi:hypothetical protein